ncbi:MAG: alkaline phosphatase D family protein [Lysobacterales bacterium]
MTQRLPSARAAAAIASGRLSRRQWLQGLAAAGLLGGLAPRQLRAQAAPRFIAEPFRLGVASGYPTPDGISLWTRLAPMPLVENGGLSPDEWLPVSWQVAEDERFGRPVAEGQVRAVPELAHSVHVDVQGLRPDRGYYYRFLCGQAVSPVGRTRTAPAADAMPDALRLAFSSCQHYEQGYFSAYAELVRDDPRLMIFLGDYIYENSWGDELVRRHAGGEPYTLAQYRVRHAQYKTDPDLQRAHAAMPWLFTWDDHEVDNDPSSEQSEHLDPRFLLRRAAAYQAYYEHMPLPARMRPRLDGSMQVYGQVDFGALLSIFLLDDRQYRSAMACTDPAKGGGSTSLLAESCAELERPGRTMLGSAQEQWLLQALGQSGAHWNLLAQQTLLSPKDDRVGPGRELWTDGWDGYPASQRQLLEALGRPELANPVVIGGDVHANIVANLQLDPWSNSPVLAAEVCGTSISSQGWAQENYDAIRPENPQLLYARSDRRGYALLDMNRRQTQVTLRSPQTVKTPTAPVETLARFVVESGRRGIRGD